MANETLQALKVEAKELGIDFPNNITEPVLQEKIDAFKAGIKPPVTEAKKMAEIIKCKVQSMDENEKEITVGSHGKFTQIILGEEVELSRAIINILKNAVETKYIPITDKQGNVAGSKPTNNSRYMIDTVL